MAFPKDLRQKMINLMYLVLMALLALQIDASTLLAFQQVNRGLDNAAEAFNNQNVSILGAIQDKAQEKGDGSMASQFLDQAKAVKSTSAQAQSTIEEIISQVRAYATSEGKEFDDFNKDAARQVMLNEEGSLNRAPDVKATLESVRQKFTEIVNNTEGLDDEEKQELINNIPIDTAIPNGANPENLSWEEFTYRGKPAVALLTLLKQAQNNIKTTEGSIIGKYAQKLDIDDIKFDQFKAAVIPSSTYLQQGDPFTADIFLAASSSRGSNNYNVVVNGQTIAVDENGVARYSATNSVGEHSINGQITVTNPETGEVTTVPFENPVTYQVAAPSANVSADKMNVLYIGVDNPVSVSAAGVPLNSVSANCAGCTLTKQGAGQYTARVTEEGEANITVTANGKNMGTSEFRVKRIPDPVVKLGTKKAGSSFSTGEIAAQSFVQADLENFDFDTKFSVVSYDLWLLLPGKPPYRVKGSGQQLSSEAKNYLARLPSGAQVALGNVKAKGPSGEVRDIGGALYGVR